MRPGCLVYPDYRYSSLLRPVLVTGKRLNYLPTAEEEGRREGAREGVREGEPGRKRQKKERQQDEIFMFVFFFKVMSQARLTVNDQTQGLILEENVIHTYSQDNILS